MATSPFLRETRASRDDVLPIYSVLEADSGDINGMGFFGGIGCLAPASTQLNCSPTCNELSYFTSIATESTGRLLGSGKYAKFALAVWIFLICIFPHAAASSLSDGLRIINGVTAGGSALSVIPLRMVDGVPSWAWIV